MPKIDAQMKARTHRLVMSSYLPYQFAIISSRLSRALEDAYGERHQLSRTEWRTLALLAECPNCFASDLVMRSGMDAVAVHRALKKLENLGLVIRQTNSQDRRWKPLALTINGKRVYEDVLPHALALERRLLQGLTRNERAALVTALDKLMEMEFAED